MNSIPSPIGTGGSVPVPVVKESALTVGAIFGATVYGKTNAIRALGFIARAVANSHRLWASDSRIAIPSFRGAPRVDERPTEFQVDFMIDGRRYKYGFSVNPAGILNEVRSAFVA